MLRSLLLVGVALVPLSVAANAQESSPKSGVTAVEEITVTATRRETSLQKTPVTVSAVTAEMLSKFDMTRVDQVAAAVPNFYVAPGVANSSTVSVSMRGRGDNSGGFGITEQPVGFYFDDVYQARPAAVNSEFSDIERIEVLRGPQGTLFGRNSMTGAVNIISSKPGDKAKGNISASYGNYETVKLRGAISGPLVPGALAGSLAAVFSDQGKGYVQQIATGGRTDARDFWGVRGKLRFYGSDIWEVTLTGSHTENRNDGFVPSSVDPATLQPLSGSYLKTWTPLDSAGSTNISSGSLQVIGDFAPFTMKSITAYSKLKDRWLVDLTGGRRRPTGEYVTGFARHSIIRQEQFSQEFQIFGDGLDGKLDWIGGLYFFNEKVFQSINDTQYRPTTDTFANSPEIAYTARTQSIAGFAQLTYEVVAGLKVVAGGRYTIEDKKIAGSVGAGLDYSGKTSFSSFTPKFGLNYEISPELFAYASISQGFRSGGYPAGGTTVQIASTPFGPEKVWAYEIGVKTDLLDRRVRFNLAGFVNDFDDLVVNYFIPGTPVIVQANGLSERVYGIEAELNIKPVQGLDIYFNGGWQKETRLRFEPGAQVPAGLQRNAVVPNYSGTTGFRYEMPVALFGADTLRFGGDFVFRDWMFSNINNLPVTRTSTIRELNAEVTLASQSGWKISATGRNLANREQWKNGIGLGFLGAASRQPVEPRTYRLEFSYAF